MCRAAGGETPAGTRAPAPIGSLHSQPGDQQAPQWPEAEACAGTSLAGPAGRAEVGRPGGRGEPTGDSGHPDQGGRGQDLAHLAAAAAAAVTTSLTERESRGYK